MTMRAAVYVRVSTGHGGEGEQSTETQLPELLALCAQRGWTPVIFRETASGAKARPVLDKVLADAQRGHFCAVAIWALDRLGRDLWDILSRVRTLTACNVRLVSLRDPWIDTDGHVRELLLLVFAWVASFERQRLRERTRAGLARARAAGKRIGRPSADVDRVALALGELRQLHLDGGRPSLRACAARNGISARTLARAVAAKGVAENEEPAPSAEAGPVALRR